MSAYVLVGDLYRDQRNPDRALVEYMKALAIDNEDSAALMGAAAAYFTRNQLDEAAAMDSAALVQRPLDVQMNLLMAEIFAAKNQYVLARPYLAKCLAAPSELQFRVHYLLGRAEMEDGRTEQAIRQFEMALPGDKDGSTHYQLSRLYRKTGDFTAARKAEERAKALIQKRDASAAIAVREAVGVKP
jgi:tetratricopeptide (TPR) repeat protein